MIHLSINLAIVLLLIIVMVLVYLLFKAYQKPELSLFSSPRFKAAEDTGTLIWALSEAVKKHTRLEWENEELRKQSGWPSKPKKNLADFLHTDSPSLSLPTKEEAVNTAVQRFVVEMVSEHSAYSIQKQVNINGVLLQVTLDIVGDAESDPIKQHQWPSTAKAGLPIEGFDKEAHHQ